MIPKKSFGILLVATTIGVTPNGVDIASYLFMLLFFKEVFYKRILTKRTFTTTPIISLFSFLYGISFFSFIIFNGFAAQEIILAYTRIFFTLVLFFTLFNDRKSLAELIPFIWAALGLLMLHVYTQYLNINPLADLRQTKWARMQPNDLGNNYVNSNTYSAYISWTITILMGYYKLYSKESKIGPFRINVILILLFVLSFPILGLLGSRSNIGLLLVAFLFIYFNVSILRILIFLPIIIIGVNIIDFESLLLNYDIPLIGESANYRIDLVFAELSEDNNQSRFSLATAGLTVFSQNLLFGIGVGNEIKGILELTGQDMVSHNTFINLCSELGLLGVIISIWFYSLWVRHFNSRLFLLLFTTLFMYGLFHDVKLMSWTWLTLGIFWVMLDSQLRERFQKRKLANAIIV